MAVNSDCRSPCPTKEREFMRTRHAPTPPKRADTPPFPAKSNAQADSRAGVRRAVRDTRLQHLADQNYRSFSGFLFFALKGQKQVRLLSSASRSIQSKRIPAALITGGQRFASFFRKAAISAGVLPTTCAPAPWIRSLTSGCASVLTISS